MKTSLKSITGLLLVSLIVLSCEDDQVIEKPIEPEKSIVQFNQLYKEFAENSGEQLVSLKLDKPALKDGTVTLRLNTASALQRISITPQPTDTLVFLHFQKGDSTAQVKIQPINNTIKDGTALVKLSIAKVPAHFVSGTGNTINISIKDDDVTQQPVASEANFSDSDTLLLENQWEGIQYEIKLSTPAAVDGNIAVQLSSPNALYGSQFVTYPAASNNLIVMHVSAGSTSVSFTVKPIENATLNGHLDLNLSISTTSGSIIKGENAAKHLTIVDDELAGKPKGYEVRAGASTLKKFYEYNENGTIAKVRWESHAQFYMTQGADTYFYNGAGQLVKINKAPGTDIFYIWLDGRIVKSERRRDDVLIDYAEYGYDDRGNVAGVFPYYRQNDGVFRKGMFSIYLYFTDGNLYKSLTYTPFEDDQDAILLSTKTYESYLDVENPFPMTEILPNVKSQKKIATKYRVEESGLDQTYDITYEYREDGKPAKRTATSSNDSQVALYYYY